MQSHIPNVPRCVHNDPQTLALECLHPPHIRVRQVAPSGTRIVEDRPEQLIVQDRSLRLLSSEPRIPSLCLTLFSLSVQCSRQVSLVSSR
uniref:Uncharacterized protein n=1 Tax=Timema bartmani TaxID=61472 RepID=A0A7R9ES55_9NEOP|nr:unnamed protein product [Timema bartmani]